MDLGLGFANGHERAARRKGGHREIRMRQTPLRLPAIGFPKNQLPITTDQQSAAVRTEDGITGCLTNICDEASRPRLPDTDWASLPACGRQQLSVGIERNAAQIAEARRAGQFVT